MKRALLLVIPLLISLTSCSDQLNTNEGDGEIGEIIEPVYSQDTSGDKSAIILKDVPGIEFLAKSVLIENGIVEEDIKDGMYYPDVAMIVNQKSLLKEVEYYGNTFLWPEIDFEEYSLVIGQFYTNYYNDEYHITQQYIVKGSSKNVLYFDFYSNFGFATSRNNYFATLYPKLPDGELEVKRLNNRGNGLPKE